MTNRPLCKDYYDIKINFLINSITDYTGFKTRLLHLLKKSIKSERIPFCTGLNT